MADDHLHVNEARRSGASGYLIQTASKSELENALRAISHCLAFSLNLHPIPLFMKRQTF